MRQATIAIIAIVALCSATHAQQEAPDFDRHIRPILADNCYHCHGPDAKTREADLRLDTKDGLFKSDDENTIVVSGKPEESELIRRVTSDDEFTLMPPPDSNRTLSDDQISLLKRWVASGAKWSGHWAWTAPTRPPIPQVTRDDWPLGSIDRFILARLEQEGIEPQQPADKAALLRRVTLDLTGLPPTPAETKAFLDDDSPDAYERVVDRLLNSPSYGERMAWDWLDAARYADSSGYQGDPERTMWPWRDWVIEAMNSNMPFDQFTIEQIAGDQLPNPTEEQILATGFNRNHMHNGEGGRIAEETRVENVMDRVETTSTVWLGATIGCARCHDHKFDPFSQREYYQLYAFFNNTSENGGGRGGQNAPAMTYTPAAEQRRLDAIEWEIQRLAENVNQLEAEHYPEPDGDTKAENRSEESTGRAQLPEKVRGFLASPPAKRNLDQLKQLREAVKESDKEYHAALHSLISIIERRDRVRGSLPKVMIMDTLAKPRTTNILVRGTYNKPADPVTAGTPGVLPPLPESDVNRLALAKWLVGGEHPLTARVTVNRYWQTFFGTGLVKTVEDFGTQGEKPSHPELLDWLAVEFVESGWNVKHIHRLIVTSAAYRQSSAMTAESHERDPDNRLLARGPRFRMPSWMIRDQALAASGLLVDRVGGPPVKPYQPQGIWAEATFGKKRYQQDSGEKLYRRSIYTFWRRIVGPTMFFDVSPRQTCVVGQTRTNTPLHALVTLNETTYVESGRAFGELILQCSDLKDDTARIDFAYRRLLGRPPREEEVAILTDRLNQLRERYARDAEAAKSLVAVGDSPRNEQFSVAELAPWTVVCTMLLNLDETVTKQ